MTQQAVQSNVGNLGAFGAILSDMRGENLWLELRAPGGELIEVKGLNVGDRVIDVEGREFRYSEFVVEEIY